MGKFNIAVMTNRNVGELVELKLRKPKAESLKLPQFLLKVKIYYQVN